MNTNVVRLDEPRVGPPILRSTILEWIHQQNKVIKSFFIKGLVVAYLGLRHLTKPQGRRSETHHTNTGRPVATSPTAAWLSTSLNIYKAPELLG